MDLIDYRAEWYSKLITFLDQAYKDLGYSGLELDSLDQDLNDIETIYASPSCFKLLIDKSENQIIATLAVKLDAEQAELKRVFVDSSLQGQGFGKKLSLWAFDYAREQGAKNMDIWSGTLCKTAHEFYQRLGAIDQKKSRFLGGVDDVEELHFLMRL